MPGSGRRPSRVVFNPPGEQRPGTVVAADSDTAHEEARAIARDGSVAEVQYIAASGNRTTLAIYRP